MANEMQNIIDVLIDHIDKAIAKGSVTNQQVASVLDFLNEGLKANDTRFIHKDQPDSTNFLLRANGGLIVRSNMDKEISKDLSEVTFGGKSGDEKSMSAALMEVPKSGGLGSSSLGEMDNTDESFDSVPDGNYMMQKRAGVYYPVKAAAAGGGTKLTLGFVTPSNITAVHGKDTLVKYSFSSTLSGEDTGEGIATYTVNSKQVASESIAQGEVVFNAGKYLSLGDNTLIIQVTDSYGASRKLTFKISAVSISVSSTFDDSRVYSGAISFPYTPQGAVEKTIHFIVDGKEIGTYVTSVSNRQQTYSIPVQTHGSHTLEVYATATINELPVESDHLRFDIISIVQGNNTPVIASSFRTTEVEQFSTLLIPYIVYNPAATTSNVTLSANGAIISSQTVDRTRQTWSYRTETPGELELKIACGPVSKTFNLTVTESDIDVHPEEADLVLFLTSVNRSNNEEGKNIWSYGNIFALLTAFNYATNGWIKTIDGFVALRVNGDARVTIPYNSFANDFRATGKTIEFEFETRDVTDYDAIILSCMNGGIGLEVTAQKAVFKSEQSTVETQFKEDERVRVSFVVEKKAENRLVFVYINGELSGVVQYPEQDNFTQPTPAGISIGSSDCTADIFNIRIYDNALNRYQLLDNYIADMDNLEQKRKLYARNNIYDDYGNVSYEKLVNQNISFTIIGELPTFKGDKKIVTLICENREHPERSWIANKVEIDVQGTSSQWFPRKNFKAKCKDGFIMTQSGEHVDKVAIFDGEIAVSVFCFKADFAESSGVHNTGMARLIDYILRGMGFLTEAQKMDPRTRTTVNGRPAVMWHQTSENAEKTFLGKYNYNNDKSTNETFGFKVGCESWEILNNTSDRVLFKKSDYITVDSEGNIEWLKDFESRYPDGNEDYTNLKRLTDWLASVKDDPDKFRREADQYFDMDFMLSYYTITEFFAMIDQRAKNMFLTTFDGIHWICIFYDNDTCFGINNEGAVAFDYTVEYHDKIGNKDVWNGAESTLWNNIEKAYQKEIAAMYADMRSKKLLTYDECIRFLDTEQGDLWCEAVYNEDSWFKYVRPLLDEGNGSYLYAAQGSRKMHRRWWLYNRFKYMDSKYIAGDYKNDFATLRLYTPTEWEGVRPNADMTITASSGQYVNVQYGSYTIGERASKNVPVSIKAPAIQFNDTETIIFGAGQISSLGDISALYPGTVDVSKMTRLVNLIIGSGVEGYRNTNLEVLSVGANNLLRKLDVRNCPNLKQAIDLSQCYNVREVFAEGTGTTAVVLPDGGNLTLLHLPDTITNLTIRNQSQLEESGLYIEGVQNLSTIRWENTDKANVLSVIDKCFAQDSPKLERVRIINADWMLPNLDLIMKLAKLKGLDENGDNTNQAVITGKCYVLMANEAHLNKIKEVFPELVVTYGQLKPATVTTFVFGSSQGKTITNASFACNLEYEKVNEYTYKVTAEDGVKVEITFKCDNHQDCINTYLVAGTRTQNYTATYIPLRTIRVKVYNQSIYVPGATVTIGSKLFTTDKDGYITYRSGEAITGTVSAYGYAGNTFSFFAITSDTTNTVEVYAAVEVKFIVKFGSVLVEGATVKSGTQSGVTNMYGECILVLGKGTHDYSVTHPDYITKTGSTSVGTSALNVNVSMEPNTVELSVVVSNEFNDKLQGAIVICNSQMIETDENGKATFIVESKKDHVLNISKENHIETENIVTVGIAAITSNIYLDFDILKFKPEENGNIQMLFKGKAATISISSTIANYVIEWGDGETDSSTGTGSITYSHTYPDTSFYQVEVKAHSGITQCVPGKACLIAYWSIGNSTVKNVTFDGFYNLKHFGSVFKNDTQRTSLLGLFRGCARLTSIDLTSLSLFINVTHLGYMFYGCTKLTSIDLTPLAGMTKNYYLDYFFANCSSLTSVNLSPLSGMTNVLSLCRFCYRCTSLTSIDLSPFEGMVNAANITNMFEDCGNLTSIDLSPIASMINVTSLDSMLWGCSSLTSIDLSPLAYMDNVTTADSFIRSCSGLTYIDLTPLASMKSLYNISRFLMDCSKLVEVSGETFDNAINELNLYVAFYRCHNLRKILLPKGFSTLRDGTYQYCSGLQYIISELEVPHTITSSTFDSTGNCSIYVPDASVNAYKTATNWIVLADRIKPMSQFATDFPEEEI